MATARGSARRAARGLDRRGFLRGSAQAAAGALIAAGARSPAPAAAEDVAPASAVALGDAGYWAFADRVQDRLDVRWRPRDGRYANQVMVNAALLSTHAAAALAGHQGPARRDERALAIAEALCRGPAWVGGQGRSGAQGHPWGWQHRMDTRGGFQHLVIDAEVASALACAWRARAALGLPDAVAARIAERVDGCARSAFWRWPAVRLNQVNWYARVYAAAAAVTGDGELLRHDLALQLRRFLAGARRPADGARVAHLGPGYRFRYLPHAAPHHPFNLDSAEYANIVCSLLLHYDEARAAGMPAVPPADVALVRAWVSRVLCGYWTHAGYLNWDTGLSFRRWHQGKKLGLAQGALLGIVVCAALRPDDSHGRWAKHVFDQGLRFYDRQAQRTRDLPPAVLFDSPSLDRGPGGALLFAARMQANAARAVLLGLGAAPSETPPALYAYDPDVGRLAVTTPAYNTAVVPVTQGALPYGGIELARLYDGEQEVAAGIGGRPPAAFGVVLRDRRRRVLAASQRPHARPSLRRPPLRLVQAPRGAVARPAAHPRLPHAGPFRELRAVGHMAAGGLAVTTAHRFTASFVETRWTVVRRRRRHRRGGRPAELLFPSWGDGARVVAVLRGGDRMALRPGSRLPARRVAWLHVQSEHGGYVIVPVRRPPGAVFTVERPRPQDSAPRPGPTLVLRLGRRDGPRRAVAAARIAPASSGEQARAVAARLRG